MHNLCIKGMLVKNTAYKPSDFHTTLLDMSSSHEMKRQGLIPFPRVGRSHDVPSSPYGNDVVKIGKVKRTGDAVSNGGMWFGPRLGRLHRRTDDPQSEDQQWAAYPLRGNSHDAR